MSQAALRRRSREAYQWLMEACFPLWAEEGVSRSGGFFEALSLEHRAIRAPETRVRVQARQTYVFAQAHRFGWQTRDSARLVAMGSELLESACLGPLGVAGRILDLDTRTLIDAAPDLYDMAFVLLAQAEAARILDDAAPALRAAERLLSALDTHMKIAPAGGYAETLPAPATRLQNPHMHLLEACLALYNAEPSSALLRRAGELTGLFEKHFTAGQGGLLGERFNHDWSMRDGADADHIEPGHQFEWVWLLHMYARTVRQSVSPAAERLYRFACTTLNSRRHAIMAVTRTGAPVDATARTWSQTEALKAHLVQFEATGEVQAARLAAEAFDVLIEDFLTAEGGWRDHLGADGTLLARNMPASTGYHVVLALSELIRIAGL